MSAIIQCQNGSGLVCGLSTRKMRTPWSTQNWIDVAQRDPQCRHRRFCVEIGIDDVLVFLGRVFSIPDRSVGAPAEPVGMLAQPWMVRRALNGEIERDLQPVVLRRGDQRAEVVERAELRMHRIVPALGTADRIGTAHDRPVRRAARCCGPCGWSCRSDGSAGNTARRSP